MRTIGHDRLVEEDRIAVASAAERRTKQSRRLLAGYEFEGERPTHFETGTGFSLSGTTARGATLGRYALLKTLETRSGG